MAILVPNVGEVELLKRVLYQTASSENFTLKLYSNNVTPAETDTAGTYTEATFTGYVAKTLTSTQAAGTWGVPVTAVGVTTSTYGTAQNWLPTTSQTIYGYFIIGTTTTILLMVESFTAGKPLANGDSLTITPVIALD